MSYKENQERIQHMERLAKAFFSDVVASNDPDELYHAAQFLKKFKHGIFTTAKRIYDASPKKTPKNEISTLTRLADALGMDRSNLHKLIR